MMYKMWKR